MKIIDCPRDAMQGYEKFIETNVKIEYINKILKIGFDTIDFGSFVNPKAIPQMADTKDVLKKLDLINSKSKLLAIVANDRGAKEAAEFDEISYLGYPFSISETFQKRNTNSTISESFILLDKLQNISVQTNKTLVIYISMGFGNPYNDPYSTDIVSEWVDKISNLEVKIISLADTIGSSNNETISKLFNELIPKYPNIEFGAHLHSTPDTQIEKLESAYNANCKRFDGAIKGYGGCPMAEDKLTGNMATENIVNFLLGKNVDIKLNLDALQDAISYSNKVFN